MKLRLVLLYLAFNMPLFAQSKVPFYYPLAIGDIWEYWQGPNFFVNEQRKVIGDTLLANGKTYKVIEIIGNQQNRVLKFQRVEDRQIFEYAPRFVPPDSVAPSEILLYEIKAEVGNTWPYQENGYQGFLADSGFYRVDDIGTISFAGQVWRKMVIGSYSLPDSSIWFAGDVVFLDSLGIYIDAFDGGYYQLRGAIIGGQQFGILTFIKESRNIQKHSPRTVSLMAAYPNPVVSGTKIIFKVNSQALVHISIFDITGKLVYEFPLQKYEAGLSSSYWDGTHQVTKQRVSSGLYICILTSNLRLRLTRKLLVLK